MKGRISAEQAVFGGLVLLAVLLRVWNLGSTPLRPGEAAVAFQAWSVFRGLPSTVEYGPAITYGNALIFSIFGANDASARVLPAIAGSVLVALCFFARPQVGRHAAIASAFLLAVSPTLVFFSRYVGSEMIAAAALLASTVLLFRYVEGRGPVNLYGFAAAVGLAVSATVTAFVYLAMVLVFVGFIWLLRWARGERWLPSLARDNESADGGVPRLALHWDARVARNAALVLGAVVLLAGTGVFSNLHGIQEGIIEPLFQRASPFVETSNYSLAYYAQVLIIYETVVIVFSVVRVLYSRRPKGLFTWFLIWWAFASLVFYSLMPQKSALLVIQPLLPAVLLAGDLIGDLAARAWRERPYLPLGVLAGITFPPLLLIVYLLSYFSLPGKPFPWELAMPLLLVLGLAIVGFVVWKGDKEASRLGGVYVFSLLLLVYVHVGSNLNFQEQPNPAELLVPSVTLEDVRNLAIDVTDLVRLVGERGAGKDVFVDSRFQYPLAWYLRQQSGVEYAPMASGNPAIVLAREGSSTGTGQRAIRRYLVLASWQPRQLDLAMLWRWLAYRELNGPVKYEGLEVSVRP